MLVHLRYSLIQKTTGAHNVPVQPARKMRSRTKHNVSASHEFRDINKYVGSTAQYKHCINSGINAQSVTARTQASCSKIRKNSSAMDVRCNEPWSRKASRDVARIRGIRYNNVRQAYTIACLNSLEREGQSRDPTRRHAVCDSQHRVSGIQAPNVEVPIDLRVREFKKQPPGHKKVRR